VVTQVPLGNVNVSVPTIAQGGAAADQPEKPELELTVTVSANGGFIIAGSGGIVPTIPKLPNNQYDYDALTSKLVEIKNKFPDETKAKFNADASVPYEIVIKTLDAMREDAKGKRLFPDIVGFAAGIE
jgi:biopolymer transport protein ExbD